MAMKSDAGLGSLGRLVGTWTTEATHPAMRWWRDAPGFSQRFTGEISTDGNTIVGRSQLCRDDVHWADDLQITYRRGR